MKRLVKILLSVYMAGFPNPVTYMDKILSCLSKGAVLHYIAIEAVLVNR